MGVSGDQIAAERQTRDLHAADLRLFRERGLERGEGGKLMHLHRGGGDGLDLLERARAVLQEEAAAENRQRERAGEERPHEAAPARDARHEQEAERLEDIALDDEEASICAGERLRERLRRLAAVEHRHERDAEERRHA